MRIPSKAIASIKYLPHRDVNMTANDQEHIQISADSKLLVDKVIRDEKLTECHLYSKKTSQKGDGYLGLITFLTLEGKTLKGERVKLDLITKVAPKSKKLRSDVPIQLVYSVEGYHYAKIHPILRQFQSDHRITQPFEAFAKCYAVSNDEDHEGLVLQDLSKIGYKLWDRKVPMNEQHLELVLKEYGKLHATSLALKTLHPQKFAEIKNDYHSGVFNMFLENCEEAFHAKWGDILDSFDRKLENHVYQKLKTFKETMFCYLVDETSKVDEYSVISHGDCWTNNMMFLYEDNNTPSGLCFLDWQISRISSPILDISYFFYSCSSADSREKVEEYLQLYYKSLSDHLEKFRLVPEHIFPPVKFREHWKLYSKFGMIMSVFIVKLMMSDSEESPDLTTALESGMNCVEAFSFKFSREAEYLEIARGILRHFVQHDFI